MTYYWIRHEDWQGQEIFDEVEIEGTTAFVKVKDTKGAMAYSEETVPEPAIA